jgi:hypothetical protein
VIGNMVELTGIEPVASSLRTTGSPQRRRSGTTLGTTRMRPESSKRFQVNEISFPASGYEPEGREFESLRAHHLFNHLKILLSVESVKLSVFCP